MMDLLLHDKDLKLQNGDVSLCPTDTDAISQAIKIRLKTLAGEWFLDTRTGVPYLTEIFGHKRSMAFLRSLIVPQIESLAGIASASDFSVEIGSTRTAHIKFVALLSNQQSINFSESVEI